MPLRFILTEFLDILRDPVERLKSRSRRGGLSLT